MPEKELSFMDLKVGERFRFLSDEFTLWEKTGASTGKMISEKFFSAFANVEREPVVSLFEDKEKKNAS